LILFLREVAQVFQFDGEVDVVDHDFFRHGKHDGREVQDACHARVNKLVRHFLRGDGGHGEDGHLDILLGDKVRQFIHAINRLLDLLVALALWLGVKGGDNLKSFLLKSTIRNERESEMSDADENHRLQPRRAEFLGDFFEEVGDIVAEPTRAERAEVGEVFAQLRRLDARRFRQRLAAHGADAVLVQSRKAAQINRKAINRLARDFGSSILLQARKN